MRYKDCVSDWRKSTYSNGDAQHVTRPLGHRILGHVQVSRRSNNIRHGLVIACEYVLLGGKQTPLTRFTGVGGAAIAPRREPNRTPKDNIVRILFTQGQEQGTTTQPGLPNPRQLSALFTDPSSRLPSHVLASVPCVHVDQNFRFPAWNADDPECPDRRALVLDCAFHHGLGVYLCAR
ncbi:hypothetical protein AG1IA_08849 [Rhizoctonia solani AG-1 IA]|uniref:Uncharacterized protein n=1 Tax=Thanatephorus cucumeris (strain AG1-IA) TaxID=983506 RepID=L8WG00_THACA|nr:hypothetical protein AG1IA_08849 [Rhizoctonia solani AG-1 IA]